MKCPKCDNTKEFVVRVRDTQYSTIDITLNDDGFLDDIHDEDDVETVKREVGADYYTKCDKCMHKGLYSSFEVDGEPCPFDRV